MRVWMKIELKESLHVELGFCFLEKIFVFFRIYVKDVPASFVICRQIFQFLRIIVWGKANKRELKFYYSLIAIINQRLNYQRNKQWKRKKKLDGSLVFFLIVFIRFYKNRVLRVKFVPCQFFLRECEFGWYRQFAITS